MLLFTEFDYHKVYGQIINSIKQPIINMQLNDKIFKRWNQVVHLDKHTHANNLRKLQLLITLNYYYVKLMVEGYNVFQSNLNKFVQKLSYGFILKTFVKVK